MCTRSSTPISSCRPTIFARIMATLESEPEVGIAGSSSWRSRSTTAARQWSSRNAGMCAARPSSTAASAWRRSHRCRRFSAGTRSTRRARGVSATKCRAAFEFPEQPPLHLRPTGSYDGVLRGYRRRGAAAWGYGAHPLNVAASAALRMRDRPRCSGPRLPRRLAGSGGASRVAGRAGGRQLPAAPSAQTDPDVADTVGGDRQVNARVLILVENEPYPHDRRVRQEALALTRGRLSR